MKRFTVLVRICVGIVRQRFIQKPLVFKDVRYGIHTESGGSAIQPEAQRLFQLLKNGWIFVVQIRLLAGELVQVPLAAHFIECPRRTTKDADLFSFI